MSGLGFYLSNFIRQTYLNNLEMQLAAQARLIADHFAVSPETWEDPEELERLALHWADLLGTRVTLIGADGTVLGESLEDREEMDNHLNRPEIQQALAEGKGSSTRYSQTVGFQMFYSAVPITGNGQTVGFIRIALPLVQVQADLVRLQRTITGITVLTAALTLVLATWIAGRTTRPLRELTEAARKLSRGELEGKIVPTTNDEVGQLTQEFNLMSRQLQSQIEALETERSKMAAVLQAMTDGVLIVDGHGEVQLINPAAESMFAVNRDQALGHSLAEVLRHHELIELWERCSEMGEAQAVAIEISSRRLYLQGIATPLGQSLPGNTLFVFQNLTRLHYLETVRRDFISNLSHELRTPLASLRALTETLQEGALDDPPAARRFLNRMELEVDALTQMVAELLELSRIESGRVPLKLKPTPAEDILAPALERLRLQAERSNLKVEIDCTADLPPVLADQGRLEQVVVNLLHNAIKYTPPGGEIFLKARFQDGSILFSVEDTGVGIPKEDLPRIFERFYKADRARSSSGTGLGLAIARHMVEAHGGRIWAESQEGAGSTFYFNIPLAH
jgi:two-component system phosphate regulon sensor histidine kinase PhoR